MIDVSRRQLRDAFNRHSAAARSLISTDSQLLLLIYAAECGLKCICLAALNVHTTARLEEDDRAEILHHDIDRLLSRVRAPSALRLGGCPDANAAHVRSADLHQALRYGIALEPQNRQRVVASVQEVIKWADERMQ